MNKQNKLKRELASNLKSYMKAPKTFVDSVFREKTPYKAQQYIEGLYEHYEREANNNRILDLFLPLKPTL